MDMNTARAYRARRKAQADRKSRRRLVAAGMVLVVAALAAVVLALAVAGVAVAVVAVNDLN